MDNSFCWPEKPVTGRCTINVLQAPEQLLMLLVPVAGLETAERFSLAFACCCNGLQERMLRAQRQNVEIASERTKAKENEKMLSSIVIKNIGFLHGRSFSESLEPSCSTRRWRAPSG